MQELLYSEYIEKHGLDVQFTRGIFKLPPGAVLALDENNKMIRYTHARTIPEPIGSVVPDPVNIRLRQMGEPEATVTARVRAPVEIATIDKQGRVTVTNDELWLQHVGELLNCYTVKGASEPPILTPDG